MRPVTERWARLGKWNPSMLVHTSDAGVCLSAFVVARRGNSVLVCRPRGSDAWPKKGDYPKHLAVKLELEGAWLMPATHLLMEESPDNAAQRIAREWVGLVGRPRFVMVQSHTRPHSLWRRNAEGKHWDICFVYELAVRGIPKTRPWWSEMRIVPFSQVRRMKMGRGHKDILKAAGYI
jgi:ADP-ribose pyrophosphatase YjhB (NUDIX family)